MLVGDDAEAVAGRGFEVTAFDISPTAVELRVQTPLGFPSPAKGQTVLPLVCQMRFARASAITNVPSGVDKVALSELRPLH